MTAAPAHRPRPAGSRAEAALRGIARGSGLNLGGAVCTQAVSLAVTVLLSWTLGGADLGRYAQALAFLFLLGMLARTGFGTGLVRFVAVHRASGDVRALRGTVRIGLTMTVGSAAALGGLLFVLAPWLADAVLHDGRLVTPLRFVAVTLPAAAFAEAALSATQGFQTMRPSALIGLVTEPLVRLALTGLLIAAGLGLPGAMAALLVSQLLSAGLAAVALRRRLGEPVGGPPTYQTGALFRFSVVSGSASLASTGLIWADTLLLGAFRSSAEVGTYTVATRLVVLATFVLPAVNAAFAPRIADLHHRGEHESLARAFAAVTTWNLCLSLPAFAVILAFPRELLSLFGAAFTVGASATVVLAVGKMVDTATGPSGLMLNMSGRPGLSLADNVAVLALNVVLNLWLIPRYGIVGSAVAWAVSLALVNVVRVAQVWWTLRMRPFERAQLKAVAAFGAALLSGLLLGAGTDPPGTLLVGAPVVCAVYAACLVVLGAAPKDSLFLAALLRRPARDHAEEGGR